LQIRIDGRNFTVTPAIKKTIDEGVAKFNKFLHNIIEVHFVLKVEKYRQIAEVILFAKNTTLKCKETTSDMHLSIEKALHNIKRQLREHKEKIKAHQLKVDKIK
jgi:putative sigma-54 modulation protein